MLINKENIEKEYRDFSDEFKSIAEDIKKSLERIKGDYYNQTKFVVFIPPLRIKSLNSILRKLEAKGRSAESLVIENGESISLVSNDFIGGRILCNTKEDVYEIEKLINKYPRFKVEKKDIIDKSSGYKALHLDLYYETFWNDRRMLVPLELQIKTHLQHAWAEITHDDAYKPGDDASMDQSLKDYYKHISGVMDGVDGILSTIRSQKLSLVLPPSHLSDADTIINAKTLSYKINVWKKGEQLTIQEMNLVLRRLKEEGFETLKDVTDLLDNTEVEQMIKNVKEDLGKQENVKAFELLTYGALITRGKIEAFEEDIKQSLGFVNEQCVDCGRVLTKDEFDYILNETDSDFKYYCSEHRGEYFAHVCRKCGKKTSQDLCLKCEAESKESF